MLGRPWLVVGMLGLIGCGCGDDAATEASALDASAPEHDAAIDASTDAGADRDASSATGCDLSGVWVTQHVTPNTALGASLLATNWNYHRIEQVGTELTIVESLDCGYVVRGPTEVSLGDATLEAMAMRSSNGAGVHGTLTPTADGEGCELTMDRIYTIRGANKARFLDAVWQIGDAPKDLSDFELPADEAEGMEDWDDDGHEAITQLTSVGDRYTAQIDWHAFKGVLPLADGELGDVIGGEGVIDAEYDAIESVSEETAEILRVSTVSMSPGVGHMLRAPDLEIATDDDHPGLTTCKNVQAFAVEVLGPPAKP